MGNNDNDDDDARDGDKGSEHQTSTESSLANNDSMAPGQQQAIVKAHSKREKATNTSGHDSSRKDRGAMST